MSMTAMPGRPGEARNRSTPKRTAYVIAASMDEARTLQDVLARLGFTSLTTFDADLPGHTLPEIIRSSMERSELVVAVLGDGSKPVNVVFELGLAHGLGKRILILADEKAVSLAQSFGDPYIRARPTDAVAIGFAVSQILAVPHYGNKAPETIEPRTRPIGELADELLGRLRKSESLREDELIGLIQRAVERSGVTAASREKLGDTNVDLAVWSEDLEPWVRNPLLIEVKRNVRSESDALRIEQQVLGYMKRAGVSTAMVLYLQAAPKALDKVHRHAILFMSVQDFLESLRESSFGEVVRRLRNESVHGVS